MNQGKPHKARSVPPVPLVIFTLFQILYDSISAQKTHAKIRTVLQSIFSCGVLTFRPVDEILKCGNSNESYFHVKLLTNFTTIKKLYKN